MNPSLILPLSIAVLTPVVLLSVYFAAGWLVRVDWRRKWHYVRVTVDQLPREDKDNAALIIVFCTAFGLLMWAAR